MGAYGEDMSRPNGVSRRGFGGRENSDGSRPIGCAHPSSHARARLYRHRKARAVTGRFAWLVRRQAKCLLCVVVGDRHVRTPPWIRLSAC